MVKVAVKNDGLKRKAGGKWSVLLLAAFSLFITILISLRLGRFEIGSAEILQFMWKWLFAPNLLDLSQPMESVFYYIRLPRILLAVMVGASLAITGTLFQGVFRNPLASPDILGVASGCAFGAALGIIWDVQFPFKIQILAFLFGLLSMFLVFTLARLSKGDRVVMLVLIGTIVSALFGAALSFLKYIADPVEDLAAIVFWTMGGLHRATWGTVLPLLFTLLPGFILLLLLSWKVNILSLGDEEAKSLGIPVQLFRSVLIVVATLMLAATISITGTIGWVGLVIPHIARILVGSDHQYTFPMSMLVGATFVLMMDDLARSLTTAEIPLSILTALVGAPFFAYLLTKGKGKVWN